MFEEEERAVCECGCDKFEAVETLSYDHDCGNCWGTMHVYEIRCVECSSVLEEISCLDNPNDYLDEEEFWNDTDYDY